MKHLIIFTIVISLSSFTGTYLFAQQWNGSSGSTGNIYRSGNVGIGISVSSPEELLHIKNNDHAFIKLETNHNIRNVGIKMEGYHNGNTATSQIYMDYYGGTGFHGLNYISGRPGFANHWFKDYTGDLQMCIRNNGNVGIGTSNPTRKLSVNGTIQAKEVIVETGWSDFVFEENYNLPTLFEVESFINKHGHLPSIPSAEDVSENGVAVGEMESKLLQKIEELTLYTISQEKRINELEERLSTIISSEEN